MVEEVRTHGSRISELERLLRKHFNKQEYHIDTLKRVYTIQRKIVREVSPAKIGWFGRVKKPARYETTLSEQILFIEEKSRGNIVTSSGEVNPILIIVKEPTALVQAIAFAQDYKVKFGKDANYATEF